MKTDVKESNHEKIQRFILIQIAPVVTLHPTSKPPQSSLSLLIKPISTMAALLFLYPSTTIPHSTILQSYLSSFSLRMKLHSITIEMRRWLITLFLLYPTWVSFWRLQRTFLHTSLSSHALHFEHREWEWIMLHTHPMPFIYRVGGYPNEDINIYIV